MYLLRVLIGLLHCLSSLWLAGMIVLVLICDIQLKLYNRLMEICLTKILNIVLNGVIFFPWRLKAPIIVKINVLSSFVNWLAVTF